MVVWVATKTRGGVLLPVVVVTIAAIVFVPQVRDKAGELLGTVVGGTELVGEGATQFMVASSAAEEVHRCTPTQVVDQQCDDVKFIIIDATRMPFIARNISTAWERGKPGVLTKDSTQEPGKP